MNEFWLKFRKFVRKGSINNIPALVQIMAWRRPGDKPLSGPMMVRLPTHACVTQPQWIKPHLWFSSMLIYRLLTTFIHIQVLRQRSKTLVKIVAAVGLVKNDIKSNVKKDLLIKIDCAGYSLSHYQYCIISDCIALHLLLYCIVLYRTVLCCIIFCFILLHPMPFCSFL